MNFPEEQEIQQSIFKIAVYDSKSYDKLSFMEALEKSDVSSTFEFHFLEPRLSLETVRFSDGCDAVCVFVNDDVGPEVLAALDEQNINCVLLRCAGFDRVDLRAANELGISVVRVPAYSPYAVAEFAVALLLSLNRKIHKAFNRIRDGNFTLAGLVGTDLHGKTIGVVGTGQIGHCFINIMIGFGCKILAFDLFPNENVKRLESVTYVSLNELFSNSDVISLHVPATPQTMYMINKAALNKMKTGVLLINTSRGKLIDSKALLESLISGHIGGAGLDVYENEKDYFFRDVSDEDIGDEILARFQNMRNVVLTSHQAFLTQEALHGIANTTLNNAKQFFLEKKSLRELTNYVPPPEAHPAVARVLSQRQSFTSQSTRKSKTTDTSDVNDDVVGTPPSR